MPPKQKKPQPEEKEEVEYLLQAVVVCDNYSAALKPLSNDIHPILLPLAGTPILGYTLEFLERGGVEDIILICSSFPTQIRSYIASSRWGENGYPVKVRIVVAAAATSSGDALREIDRLNLVSSDFVLCQGGVLCTLPLPSILEEHRRVKQLDKDQLLMTLVTMQTEANAAFSPRRYVDEGKYINERNLQQVRLHVLGQENAHQSSSYEFYRCLVSEYLDIQPEKKRQVSISRDILAHHSNFYFRNDLYSCNIQICTPEVPALFTDNFDYEDLERDLVNGVLTSDLLMRNIYCYIGKSGYGGHIASLDEYWQCSLDVVMGATIPFEPSMNIGNDQTFVKRGSLWRESGVRLDKTAQLTNAVVGSGSLIGEGAVVTNSIIGRHVTLSPGVVVKDSILWDNVFVDQGVEINQSIVVSQKVQKNIQLGKRSVIPSICELPEGTKIPDTPYFTAYSSNGEPVLDDIDTEESDDEEQDEKFDISLLNLTDSEVSEIGSDSDSDENSTTVRRRRRSSASGRSDISTNDYFLYEAGESLSRAFAENHSVDDAAIELTSLKMTTNVGFHEIREAIVTSMMNVLISQPGRAEPTFAKWSALLNRFIEDEESQLDIAFIAQEYFAKRIREQKAEKKIFVKGLHLLYDNDVVDEDVIFKWYESKKAQGMGERWSEEFIALRNAAQPLLNWLSEANEESDEE